MRVYDESGHEMGKKTALDCRFEISTSSFMYGQNYRFEVKVPGYKQVNATDENKFVMKYNTTKNVYLEATGPWKVTFNLFRASGNTKAKLYGINYNITDRYGN